MQIDLLLLPGQWAVALMFKSFPLEIVVSGAACFRDCPICQAEARDAARPARTGVWIGW